MFDVLRDQFLLMFSRRWPTTDGAITRVYLDPYERGFRLRIAYDFSLEDDGPYTGESACPFWFGGTEVMDINERFKVGKAVRVRYRKTDPSVNKVDSVVWKDLEDGL